MDANDNSSNRSVVAILTSLGAGFGLALGSGVLGGLGNLGLDLDHIPVLILKGIPITMENLATQAGRPFHIPLLFCAAFLFGMVGTLLARFRIQSKIIDTYREVK